MAGSSEKYNCNKCAVCNPAIFAREFPNADKKPRRSHADVLLEKRRKAQAIADRRELYARLKLEREARKQRSKSNV